MDNNLTLAVKELAYRLGADLVGIANIERYKDAITAYSNLDLGSRRSLHHTYHAVLRGFHSSYHLLPYLHDSITLHETGFL